MSPMKTNYSSGSKQKVTNTPVSRMLKYESKIIYFHIKVTYLFRPGQQICMHILDKKKGSIFPTVFSESFTFSGSAAHNVY